MGCPKVDGHPAPECLFESVDVIKEDGIECCAICDLKDHCNDVVEAMCASMIGVGKRWKELDCDEEAIIRMERQLAHG